MVSTLKIIEITVIESAGMDQLVFRTDLPEPSYLGKGNFSVLGFLPKGEGIEYARKTFGIEPTFVARAR
jgi:hypothetical protein